MSAPLHTQPVRAGWEDEPIVVPHAWRLYTLAFLIGLLSFVVVGCGGNGEDRKGTDPVDCKATPEKCK